MSISTVLVFNCGSSSLKFGLYRATSLLNKPLENHNNDVEMVLTGACEFNVQNGINENAEKVVKLHAVDAQNNQLISEVLHTQSHAEIVKHIVKSFANLHLPAPDAIGHRVVHGGCKLSQHCLINEDVLKSIEVASIFAPLHNKSALVIINITKIIFPNLPQIACFDTVFHTNIPEIASTLPISKELRLRGIKRYGFHGISCESIIHQLGNTLPSRLIIAHLGHGVSVTAVKDGKSIDTSMSLTPNSGVMMGTRSGDIDPSVLIYLLRKQHFDIGMLENLVDHQSGLLGVSGISSDMQYLHDVQDANPDVSLAINMFCYSLQKQVAAFISVLGGLDMLVFTGGIGENDHEVRSMVCQGLICYDVYLDEFKNNRSNHPNKNIGKTDIHHTGIHEPASRCAVHVIVTNEQVEIARHSLALLNNMTSY